MTPVTDAEQVPEKLRDAARAALKVGIPLLLHTVREDAALYRGVEKESNGLHWVEPIYFDPTGRTDDALLILHSVKRDVSIHFDDNAIVFDLGVNWWTIHSSPDRNNMLRQAIIQGVNKLL